ncbi:hypothetical protein FCULG_00006244 [Fusarium culmorum]|uniref:Uncharacterized protein n=1 Tax=Fusarium culmorum TaxID=5516 RepID=A0A2T4GTN9_FUSCU|nr:hypothetical protein FCULG_00006244 [Fusarium culmorum]
MPTTTKTIRADHKKWKCNNNVNGKPCGTINDISDVMCSSCDTCRKADTEALAADGSTIGKMYRLNDNLSEDWEYFSPQPLNAIKQGVIQGVTWGVTHCPQVISQEKLRFEEIS